MSNSIFLSHSSADEDLVEEFVYLLNAGMKIKSDNIYCTSIRGNIPTGYSFIRHIKENINNATLTILLITESYVESYFCIAEMGAAWALSHDIYPIIFEPLNYEVLNRTPLKDIHAKKIRKQEDIEHMYEELLDRGYAKKSSKIEFIKKADDFIKFLRDENVYNNKILLNFSCYPSEKEIVQEIVKVEAVECHRFNVSFADSSESWCSSVIKFNPLKNWKGLIQDERKLKIVIRGSAGIDKIAIEIKDGNLRHIEDESKNTITLSQDFEEKIISLSSLNCNNKSWSEVAELCFVIHKNRINNDRGYFDIKSIDFV
ncbi:toll/interleukin-1 receptor domain-containing protein [Sporosalibacterium faouarense]|uniref:toll/interleukin-1 receptor domain-containing protein n=1 Tax=Sporosalibacterium faouarense TaxID=516123 RepID=UPI00192AAEEA|nr:toll/interleukin-1 receptor domain-containing protein [Sporosalibacterium faouarense]